MLENYCKATEKLSLVREKLEKELTENEEQRLVNSCHTLRYYGGSF